MRTTEANQLSFINTSLNFNLREPKAAKSIIYAVIKVNNKQYKVSLNEKILTCCWSAKKQECCFLSSLSVEENKRNIEINCKINDVKFLFNKNLLYICSVEEINNTIEEIKEHLNKTSTNNIMSRGKTATSLIKEAFKAWTEQGKAKESSVQQNQTTLNKFCAYIEQSKKADSARNFLTSKGIEEWKTQMAKMGTAAKTINDNCVFITMLINKYICVKYELVEVKYNRIAHKGLKSKKCEITEKELETLRNADLNGIEEECRDLFIIQSLTGVRVGDLQKLFNGEYKEEMTDGNKTYTIETKKNEISAVIYITEEITSLLERYKDGFKYLIPKDCKAFRDKYNKELAKLFETCGIDREIKYEEQHGFEVIEKSDKISNIITSHYARHTFITHKLRQGWATDKLCYCTGHTSDLMIKQIYQHLTATEQEQQHIKEVVKEVQRVEAKGITETENNNNDIIKLIEEKRSVLAFLGASSVEIMSTEDLDDLDNLIFRVYEPKFKDILTAKQLKEIYNSNGSLIESQRVLQKLVEMTKKNN